MESYYSSDEEIAWGPLTLREIKKELNRKPKKIKQRQTDFGHCTFSVSEMRPTDPDNKSSTSGTSGYFTPNESLQREPNKNELFLEKLTKAIEEDSNEASSYVTALDTTNLQLQNDTIMHILKQQNGYCEDLDNIHQTLVDNTMHLSSDEDHRLNISMNSTIEEVSELSSSESPEIIVINDDSTDEEIQYVPQTINYVKCEKFSTSINESQDDIESVEEISEEMVCPQIDQQHKQNSSFSEGEVLSISNSESDDCGLQQQNMSHSENEENISHSETEENILYSEVQNSEEQQIEDYIVSNLNTPDQSFKEQNVSYTEIEEENASYLKSKQTNVSLSETEEENVSYVKSDSRVLDQINFVENGAYEYPVLDDSYEEKKNHDHEKQGTTVSESEDQHSLYSEIEDHTHSEQNVSDLQPENKHETISHAETEVYDDLSKTSGGASCSRSSNYNLKEQHDRIEEPNITNSKSEDHKLEDFSVVRNDDDYLAANISDLHLNEFENPTPTFTRTQSESNTLSSVNYSPVFNDTMEEMEMALREGLDYVMPGDEVSSIKDVIPVTPIANICAKKQTPRSQTKKFDYVQSRVGDYIRRKSPLNDNFKMPLKPPKSKLTPNFKSPLIHTKQFKNVVSPIGIYIKNSPGVCLKQNVPVKTLPRLFKSPATNEMVKANKENIGTSLPEVVYKPATKTVASTERDIILPSSIQKLVQEPVITKHEKRINKKDKSSVSRKLLEEDLTTMTVDYSLLNQSTEDVSFVTNKQAFIQ